MPPNLHSDLSDMSIVYEVERVVGPKWKPEPDGLISTVTFKKFLLKLLERKFR